MTRGINFAWYLRIWLTELRLPEAIFWRDMTPVRCMGLYRDYFEARRPAPAKQEPAAAAERPSLSEYLSGGGG